MAIIPDNCLVRSFVVTSLKLVSYNRLKYESRLILHTPSLALLFLFHGLFSQAAKATLWVLCWTLFILEGKPDMDQYLDWQLLSSDRLQLLLAHCRSRHVVSPRSNCFAPAVETLNLQQVGVTTL